MLTSSINCLMLPPPGTALILTPYTLVSLLALGCRPFLILTWHGPCAIVGCEFTCALRYWLSIPFFDSSHLCSCGSTLDPHGDHLLGCGQGPLRICRHDVLTYILFQALLQDNHQVRREQHIFSSSAVRPGVIFHPNFSDGKPTYFDISVRNSLLPHFLSRASLVAGVASSAGEMDKDAKYDHNVSRAGCVFFPLVVET